VADFTLPPGQSLDPHRIGFATAGGVAGALCIVALWRLRAAAQGRAGWFDAGSWFTLAVAGLLALLVVTFASRLGG
jgi:hypothetical protein